MKKTYIILGLLAIGFFTNPSLNDFKSEVKTAYNNLDGQSTAIVEVLGFVGKLQVCRKNFGVFSIYRTTYKTAFSSDEAPKYHLGICSSFLPIEANFLTKGSYSDCMKMKPSDIK
jgi:hypothetical protein